MSRAQWNAVRRNDIDLIGIDAARAQLKPARDVPPTDKQGVLLLNKRDTRRYFPAQMCSRVAIEICCLAGQVSDFKRSSCRKRQGQLILVPTSACGRMITAAPETRFVPIAARPVPDHRGYFQVNRVDRTGRALPGGWTLLVDLTKRTVVGASGDPDRLNFAAALRRGTRA